MVYISAVCHSHLGRRTLLDLGVECGDVGKKRYRVDIVAFQWILYS